MSARPSSLAEIEAAVWNELAQAVATPAHGWRRATLATVATTDGEPFADARTVVLREVDATQRRLIVYSDARSAKCAQLAAQPVGTLLFWSRELSWQLRCRLHIAVETDGLTVASRWATIRLSPAAQDYLSPLPPGAPLEAPATTGIERGHFALLSGTVLSMDWLELHPDGHRRARLGGAGPAWLQP